jgi:prolipoprotein diacylglyceryltransferase
MSVSLNQFFDGLPRTRFGRASREVSAFRVCGTVGFYGAVLATFAGGLLTGRSLLVLASLCVVAAASFFGYVYARKWVTGSEAMVQVDQVWLAELCMGGVLWTLGEPVLPYLDIVSVGVCIFLAGGRLGCLLVGCCHGRPSALGVTYGEEHVRDGFPIHLVGVRLFPVQAVEAVGLALIGLTGLAALPFAVPGGVFFWFLVAYAVMRFGLEGLRGDERPHFIGLSKARWMSLAEIGFVLWVAAGGWSGIRPREAALFAILLATLIAALAARRYFDPRPPLLTKAHLRELADLVSSEVGTAASNGRAGARLPHVKQTSRGVGVAVTRDSLDGSRALHVSVSLPGGLRDVELLCRLAAGACPASTTGLPVLGGEGVLHLFGRDGDPRPFAGDARALADRLHGTVVRRTQAEVAAIRAPIGRAGARDAYFVASEDRGESTAWGG